MEELKMYLGMARYRAAAMFPGPGVEEEIKRYEDEIASRNKKIKSRRI